MVTASSIDQAFATLAEHEGIPGLAYGVVVEGNLEHAGGVGVLDVGRPGITPGPDSVFRIASMTKSFTASVVLIARDRGLLRLDDPIQSYVPEVASWATDDEGTSITIRDLLVHRAGLPTDDPWADRLQAMTPAAFRELLSRPPLFAHPPGTTFEYSNLGYAILGHVVKTVFGESFRTVAERELIGPLGMTHTGFSVPDPTLSVATGYRPSPGGLKPEPPMAYGAFAPMGGLWSTVRDLSSWVGAMTRAFTNLELAADDPMRSRTRREMQEIQQVIVPGVLRFGTDDAVGTSIEGYGYGLRIEEDPLMGRFVGHRGGYPGFGGYMVWHVPTGIGIVALANRTYADLTSTARDLLEALVRDRARFRPRHRPSALVRRATQAGVQLVREWDADLARRVLADNVLLDAPAEERVLELPLGSDSDPSAVLAEKCSSPLQLTSWSSVGRRTVRVDVELSPESPPRIQTLDVRSFPEASGEILRRAREAVTLVNGARGPAVAPWDRDEVSRLAWFGEPLRPVRIGPCLESDGVSYASFALLTAVGDGHIRIDVRDGRVAVGLEVRVGIRARPAVTVTDGGRAGASGGREGDGVRG